MLKNASKKRYLLFFALVFFFVINIFFWFGNFFNSNSKPQNGSSKINVDSPAISYSSKNIPFISRTNNNFINEKLYQQKRELYYNFVMKDEKFKNSINEMNLKNVITTFVDQENIGCDTCEKVVYYMLFDLNKLDKRYRINLVTVVSAILTRSPVSGANEIFFVVSRESEEEKNWLYDMFDDAVDVSFRLKVIENENIILKCIPSMLHDKELHVNPSYHFHCPIVDENIHKFLLSTCFHVQFLINNNPILTKKLPVVKCLPSLHDPSNNYLDLNVIDKSRKGNVAICTQIFHKNVQNVLEFVEYYRLIGVDHIYFYSHQSNNEKTSNLKYYTTLFRVLEPQILEGFVDVFLYGYHNKKQIDQRIMGNDCIHRFWWRHEFIGIVDDDEYLVVNNKVMLPISNLLRDFMEKSKKNFVQFFSHVFSNKEYNKNGLMVIEKYFEVSDKFNLNNKCGHLFHKEFFKSEFCEYFLIHNCVLAKNILNVHDKSDLYNFKNSNFFPDKDSFINHYFYHNSNANVMVDYDHVNEIYPNSIRHYIKPLKDAVLMIKSSKIDWDNLYKNEISPIMQNSKRNSAKNEADKIKNHLSWCGESSGRNEVAFNIPDASLLMTGEYLSTISRFFRMSNEKFLSFSLKVFSIVSILFCSITIICFIILPIFQSSRSR